MTEPAETVRLLTRLTVAELSDDEITALLELNAEHDTPSQVRLAAADGLEAYASTLTSVQSDDISIDGSKRAAVLMARARGLRGQVAAAAADDAFSFDVVSPTECRPELTERGTW